MAHIDRRPGIRPRLTIGRRLDLVARAGFPACITLLLMLLIEAPLGISGQPALLPAIAVGCVWFWSLLESEFLPPPIVFLLGLLLDFLGYLPAWRWRADVALCPRVRRGASTLSRTPWLRLELERVYRCRRPAPRC